MTCRAPLVAVLIVAVCAGAVWSAEEAAAVADAPPATTSPAGEPIAPADAGDHMGRECVVEMVVRASRALADKDICFLNSCRDRRDDDNFTVVIFKAGLTSFKSAGIENPALHFLDRKIRVRGVVSEHKGEPQIVVEDPAQIELVAEPAAAE